MGKAGAEIHSFKKNSHMKSKTAQKIGPKQGDTIYDRKENKMRRQCMKSRKKTGNERGGTLLVRNWMQQATKPRSSTPSREFRGNSGHQDHVPSLGWSRHVAKDPSPFSGSHTGQETKPGAALGSEKQSCGPRGCGEQQAGGKCRLQTGGRQQGGGSGGVGARAEGTWQERECGRGPGK